MGARVGVGGVGVGGLVEYMVRMLHCPSPISCKLFSTSAPCPLATSGTISQDHFNTKFLLDK